MDVSVNASKPHYVATAAASGTVPGPGPRPGPGPSRAAWSDGMSV